jgi:hypothetical protein
MVWKLARCEIMIRPGLSDLWRFQPLIKLDEVLNSRNMKHLLAQPVVSASGHEKGRS